MDIANNIYAEWGIRSIRFISEAKQVALSEFINSEHVTVHTWRLTEAQFSHCVGVEWDLRRTLNDQGYDVVKAWVRREFEIFKLEEMPESQCKFKNVPPTRWYTANKPDADSTGVERFGIWYAAQFGTLIEPDVVSGDDIEATYRELPGEESDPMHSCMTGKVRSQYTRIYGTSPRSRMLVLRDNERIIERTMIVLPDDMPEDTPVGRGWYFIRIYTGQYRDASMSRCRMGPWMSHVGIKPVAGIDRFATVSGFKFPDHMCLPYVDRESEVRWAWDERDPGSPVWMELGWYGRQDRDSDKCYPSGRYGNNFNGGPFPDHSEIECEHTCYDCNCELSDDDVYRYEGGSTTYCESCYYDRYTHCEVSGCDVLADEMIPVHGAQYIDYAHRDCGSFRNRARDASPDSPRILFIQVELVSGDYAFVPESQVVNERWLNDMEENGWDRAADFTVRKDADTGLRLTTNILDEDDWGWIDPCDGVSYETTDGDIMVFEQPTRVARMILNDAKARDMSVRIDADTGRVRFFKDDVEYRPVPVLNRSMDINGVPYDSANPHHHRHAYDSDISHIDFLPINPNTPDTGETASTL